MSPYSHGSVRHTRVLSISISVAALIVCFQNCGSPKSSVGSSSSSSSSPNGVALDGNVEPPSITSNISTQTIYAGQEGNMSGSKSVSVAVQANSGPNEPGQTMTLNCRSSDNRIDMNCGGFVNGSAVIDIFPKDGAECFSTAATITYFVEDQANNPAAPKLKSASKTFTVNVTDACLVEKKIYAGTVKAQDNFGDFVAIDGNYAVVAATGDDTLGTDAGALNAYQLVGGQWQFTHKIVMDDGAAGEKIGSIAMRGGRLIVGDPLQNGMRGAVYIYELSGNTWVKTAKLTLGASQSPTVQDLFGYSVDISGDWAIAGAYQYTTTSNIFGAGSLFVYHKVGGVWQQSQQLFSPTPTNFEQFGFSADIEGDRLVVGAPADDSQLDGPGAVYSYRLSGSTWAYENAVLGTGTNGITNNSKFGFSVALTNNTLVVGAPYAKGAANSSGAVYVYNHTGAAWGTPQKISAPGGASGDEFGYDIAINNSNLVIASRLSDSKDLDRAGSVYQYKLSAGKYALAFRIFARDRAARDYFGSSLDLSGSTVLIGSRLDDGKPGDLKDGAGSAYFVELK